MPYIVWFLKPKKDAGKDLRAVELYNLAGQKLTFDYSTRMVHCGDVDFDPDRIPFIYNDKEYKELQLRLLYAEREDSKQYIARAIEARVKYLFQFGGQIKQKSKSGNTSRQWKKVEEAFSNGDIEKALRLVEEAIEAESTKYKKHLEKTKAVAISFFDHLIREAEMLEFDKSLSQESLFSKRQNCYNQAVRICDRGFIDDASYAEVLFKSALSSNNFNRFDDASIKYEKALTIYRKLAASNPSVYSAAVAQTLNNLAILYCDQRLTAEHLAKAITLTGESIAIMKASYSQGHKYIQQAECIQSYAMAELAGRNKHGVE